MQKSFNQLCGVGVGEKRALGSLLREEISSYVLVLEADQIENHRDVEVC